MTQACQGAEIEFPSGRKPLPGKRQQVHRSLRIVSRKGGSRMASKPELLHNQAADEIGQDFLLAYQRAVLLALGGVLMFIRSSILIFILSYTGANVKAFSHIFARIPKEIRDFFRIIQNFPVKSLKKREFCSTIYRVVLRYEKEFSWQKKDLLGRTLLQN